MAVGFENLVNTDAPDAENPWRSLRDNPGDNSGTPVDKRTYNDVHFFMRAILWAAGVTPNGLPESASLMQYLPALLTIIRAQQASTTQAGTAEIATDAETVAGTDNTRMVTPAKLDFWWDANFNQVWQSVAATIFSISNGSDFANASFLWQVIGTTVHLRYRFTVDATAAGKVTAILSIPGALGITAVTPQTSNPCSYVQPDGSTDGFGILRIGNGGDLTKMVATLPGVAASGTVSVSGIITFEIAP